MRWRTISLTHYFPDALFLPHYFRGALFKTRTIFPDALFLPHYFRGALFKARTIFAASTFTHGYVSHGLVSNVCSPGPSAPAALRVATLLLTELL